MGGIRAVRMDGAVFVAVAAVGGVVIATGLVGIVAITVDAWIVAYAGGGSGPSAIEGGGRQEKSSTATQLELGSSDRGEHAHHSCILQSILPFHSLKNLLYMMFDTLYTP